ncbi:unnamed protein product [Thlaspi arvense]|uniref:Uncharacterized protein n=1 Tax=Thlaspi arvense TaxID=13288 RepID=A0AAU9STZ2_THLAR|nr:unnamed protein product [Thlaspi arvense]
MYGDIQLERHFSMARLRNEEDYALTRTWSDFKRVKHHLRAWHYIHHQYLRRPYRRGRALRCLHLSLRHRPLLLRLPVIQDWLKLGFQSSIRMLSVVETPMMNMIPGGAAA